MAEIVMLPIEHLFPHKDNPRQDVGDVSELADSIRAKGILQNLTVVKAHTPGDFIILIGHRRYAAAKLAGLTELPCTIVEMSYEDQIATMLVENIQRSDLTVYEEAKGFQMMLNLGKTVKDVSEMSGFSETTVRHRAKLAELDEKQFRKAVDRGATLFDFIELEAFDDPEEKGKLLKVIGTADFRNTLRQMKEAKRKQKLLASWEEQISKWALKCADIQYGYPGKAFLDGKEYPVKYYRNYGTWNQGMKEEIEPPSDAGEIRYYFKVCNSQIDVYQEYNSKVAEMQEAEQAEKQRINDEYEAKKQKFTEMSERHRKLRREFILNFNSYQKKDRDVYEFLSEGLIAGLVFPMSMGYATNSILTGLAEFLGITYDESAKELKYSEFMPLKLNQPERTAVLIAYWIMDKDNFWCERWNSALQRKQIAWKDNPSLEKCVKLLTYLGYKESNEEIKMRCGSLEAFDVGSDNEEDQDDGEM